MKLTFPSSTAVKLAAAQASPKAVKSTSLFSGRVGSKRIRKQSVSA